MGLITAANEKITNCLKISKKINVFTVPVGSFGVNAFFAVLLGKNMSGTQALTSQRKQPNTNKSATRISFLLGQSTVKSLTGARSRGRTFLFYCSADFGSI
jgi:hypothetical protein